ncbi:hypothetical protein [Actinomadura sp. K4S16]|nr:hypothetical protein [Actinomadura sp. K4S16]
MARWACDGLDRACVDPQPFLREVLAQLGVDLHHTASQTRRVF